MIPQDGKEELFADCSPRLDPNRCHNNCNCTTVPHIQNVSQLNCSLETTDPNIFTSANGLSVSESESEDDGRDTDYMGPDSAPKQEPNSESSGINEMFTKYVCLRGSTYHRDCQNALKKCHAMIFAKQNVPLRLEFEPHIYVRDKNAIIVEVDIKDSWARIGYIPKQKAPKFTTAIRHREVKETSLKTLNANM